MHEDDDDDAEEVEDNDDDGLGGGLKLDSTTDSGAPNDTLPPLSGKKKGLSVQLTTCSGRATGRDITGEIKEFERWGAGEAGWRKELAMGQHARRRPQLRRLVDVQLPLEERSPGQLPGVV
ncbi:hypothetical protein SAMD00023353_2001350 [Rosellinia necatrix]|uniref:Uncharacterized protein n=1 Tax=Rosellinia necatrix TaxID=77044 RepID=A0A1W2TEY5_ROSNE|nr:hypothetical protein SAMD00023353_2001350 [Rosellinia necatrix]